MKKTHKETPCTSCEKGISTRNDGLCLDCRLLKKTAIKRKCSQCGTRNADSGYALFCKDCRNRRLREKRGRSSGLHKGVTQTIDIPRPDGVTNIPPLGYGYPYRCCRCGHWRDGNVDPMFAGAGGCCQDKGEKEEAKIWTK